MIKVILASKSPRRSEILSNLKINFQAIAPEVDENSDIKVPHLLVQHLSKIKADGVNNRLNSPNNTLIIACDTIVVCNNEILGKPKDENEARQMLLELSGRTHTVLSGLTVLFNNKSISHYEKTKVSFDSLTDNEIEFYLDSKEPMDKAGAYGIQGFGSMWINKIEGCYFNVVGLPVNLLKKMLKKIGLNLYTLQ